MAHHIIHRPTILAPVAGGDFASIFDIDLWDARDLSAVGDGNPVSTWAGTNGNHTYTAGSAPTYRTSVGGYPAVDFNGSANYLDGGASHAGLFDDGAAFGLLLVARNAATTGVFKSVWSRGNGSSNAQYIHFRWPQSTSGYNVTSNDNAGSPGINYSFQAGSVNANGWMVINFGGAGGVLNVWESGTQVVTNQAISAFGTSQTLNRAGLGALLRSSGVSYWQGDLHAVGEKSSIFTAEEITQIDAWVASEWGL